MAMLKASRVLFILILLISVQIIGIYCKRGFILIAPKELDEGKIESVHITVLDIDTPGKVTVKLVNHLGYVFNHVTESFNKEGSKRIELYFSELRYVPHSTYFSDGQELFLLEVHGIFGEYSFERSQCITVRKKNFLIFLDTDKPFYQAGQTVKFRVMLIYSDLKPMYYNNWLGTIWITDSNGVRLMQWSKVMFWNGFVQKEMELPEDPILGTWTLHVEVQSTYKTKNFVINEYVPPAFEVKITPPSKYLSLNQNFTWKICANYTYGKPVQGKLLTELKMKKHDDGKELFPMRNEEEFDGCTEITHHGNDLMADPRSFNEGLEMFAEVTERGTDIKINATSTIYPTLSGISISREDNLQYFRAGLPFRTKLVVRNSDSTPVVAKTVEVCAQARRINWTDDGEIVDKVNFCRNYTTDQQGKFVITVPPQPSNTVGIEIKETAILSDESQYFSKKIDSFRLQPWYSFTGHFLQIMPLDSVVECETTVEFEVLYTAKLSESGKIYYQVRSKSDMVHDGFLNYTFDIKDDLANYHDETYLEPESEAGCCETEQKNNNIFPNLNHIGKFTLKFDVDFKMSPNAHLILYSVNKEGNVLADSISFEVKPCFTNPVKLKFSAERQLSGAQTIIQLSAAPRSICSIGMVHKSVHLLYEGDVISKSKVYDEVTYYSDTSEDAPPNQVTSNLYYCARKRGIHNIRDRQFLQVVDFVDAITAFKKARVMVLSDLDLETRTCPPDPDGIYIGPPDTTVRPTETTVRPTNTTVCPRGVTDRPKGTTVRSHQTTVPSYFPETWLWGTYAVGEKGEVFLKEKMPDSITEWQGTAICLHPNAGLGISESASIIGFQPFFTSLTLPYSAIRGETVPIIVTVFNYLEECLPIKIHLDQTDDFQLLNGTFTFSDCICGGKSVTKRFFVSPKRLGKINITATASTVKDEEVCANVSVADIDKNDTLIKSLIVEAEGFPEEEIINEYFCMEDTKDGIYKHDYDILVNKEVVEGSERAFLSVTGYLMGPTLEGLENLVRIPIGCGEQNMITLVPNIVVMDYLKSIKRLTEKMRLKVIQHIKQGYMREQKYRHSDGSYSAFGRNDKTGSMWLTAFVVRSFASAARYSKYMGMDDLAKSRNWIISHQQDNGCFPIIGTVHHTQMKGGVGKEDKTPAILTAYVLTSLLLSGDVNKTVIEKAMKCIEATNNSSDYALSIFAYATSFIDKAKSQRYLAELNENAVTEGVNRYWENKDKSIAIETASYVILSSLNMKNKSALPQIFGIVKWLTLQRNPYGGFLSTQDTVIAIESLAKYARFMKRVKLKITVISNDLEKVFEINNENKLLMPIPTLPTSIEMEARGEGCALLQIVHRYNLPSKEPSKYFNITAESKRKQNDSKKTTLDICASLKEEEDESNMILMEIKMISGFVADKESVKSLLSIPELEMKRFEIKENQINLYFDQLTNQTKCLQFDIVQELEVEDTKPANIKIYDYYNQDKIATISYSIMDEDNLAQVQ